MNIRDLEQLASSIKDPLATLRAALTRREVERNEDNSVRAVHEEERERVSVRLVVALGIGPVRMLTDIFGDFAHPENASVFSLSPEDHAALRVRETITGESYADSLAYLEGRISELAAFDEKISNFASGKSLDGEPATVADGPSAETGGEDSPLQTDGYSAENSVDGPTEESAGESGPSELTLENADAIVRFTEDDQESDVAENPASSESEKDATAQTDGVDTAPLEVPAEEPKKKGRR